MQRRLYSAIFAVLRRGPAEPSAESLSLLEKAGHVGSSWPRARAHRAGLRRQAAYDTASVGGDGGGAIAGKDLVVIPDGLPGQHGHP